MELKAVPSFFYALWEMWEGPSYVLWELWEGPSYALWELWEGQSYALWELWEGPSSQAIVGEGLGRVSGRGGPC